MQFAVIPRLEERNLRRVFAVLFCCPLAATFVRRESRGAFNHHTDQKYPVLFIKHRTGEYGKKVARFPIHAVP
jgi:hypothetical protein